MPLVSIVMGSDSDLPVMEKAAQMLDALGISYEMRIISAHREPDLFFAYAQGAEARGIKVIIAGAGMAAHLPGMCAALFPLPVIGVPMHTTSLGGRDSLVEIIHDDVIDNAAERRNQQTVNAVWDNKIAVLLGDYLLSKVLGLMQESSLPGLLERVSSTVRQLTSGEITQLSQYNNLDLSESDYIRIVSLKTASLLETSFRLGALSAGADMVQESAYGSFGQRFGLFFQLKDDLKDYAVTSDGKGIYNDIREGNVTLPVIYTMQSLCMTERADFRHRYLQVGKSEQDLSAIAGTVRQCGALAHACGQLRQMEEELLQDCARFPASPYRDDLEYVIRETGDCGPILKL